MKKYYIPTSSLNFNNILSAESISPKDFYSKRNFGYPRWASVPENDISCVILLYDNLYAFERPQSDLEDHPLIVEYSTEEPYHPCNTTGVFYTDKTIYLDPWHTRFLFFSREDKDVALSLSSSSLETKMLRLYRNRIDVIKEIETGQYPKVEIHPDTKKEQIEYDQKLNKIKGLLYGYYIGAYLSINDEKLLSKTNTLREIMNIFVSIVSSSDKTPTDKQRERLSSLFTFWHKNHPIYKEFRETTCDENMTGKLIKIMEKYQMFPDNWQTFVNDIKKSNDDDCRAIRWVESELNKLKEEAEAMRAPLSPDKSEIVTIDHRLDTISEYVIKDETLMTIYKAWVNDILSTNKYNGKISSQRKQLADDLTIKAREILSDKWEDSQIRTFMNQIRRHVSGGEFNQPWDNGVLSSIASCLVKGDDWEQLLLFMQSKGMTDYRLAFSFYGILNGFANLTRDFTDLILNLDRNYVAEFYKECMGQLFGIDIKDVGDLEKETNNLDTSSFETRESSNCVEIIKDYITGHKSRAQKKRLESLNKVYQTSEKLTTWECLQALLRFPVWKTLTGKANKDWKNMAKNLCPKEYSKWSSNKELENQQSSLFPENELCDKNKDLHFYNDPSTISDLQDIIGEENLENVRWFFEDLQKPVAQRNWYKKVDYVENDEKIIDLFCRDKKKDGDESKIYKSLGSEKIERIRKHFNEKYGIR